MSFDSEKASLPINSCSCYTVDVRLLHLKTRLRGGLGIAPISKTFTEQDVATTSTLALQVTSMAQRCVA
jgi:hypothetical protein